MQEISGALCMRGGRKDRALVFLQHLQPALNIGGVICSCPGRQFQISAKGIVKLLTSNLAGGSARQ